MESKFHRWWLGACVAALLLASWMGGFSVAVTSVFVVIYLTGVTLIGPDDEPLDVLSGEPVDVVAAEPGWLADEVVEVPAAKPADGGTATPVDVDASPVDAEPDAIEAAADVPAEADVPTADIPAEAKDDAVPVEIVAPLPDDHDVVAVDVTAPALDDQDVTAPAHDDQDVAAAALDDEDDAVPYPDDDDIEPTTAVEKPTAVEEHSPA